MERQEPGNLHNLVSAIELTELLFTSIVDLCDACVTLYIFHRNLHPIQYAQ